LDHSERSRSLKVLDLRTGSASAISDEEIVNLRRTMSGDNIANPDDYAGRMKTLLGSMRS